MIKKIIELLNIDNFYNVSESIDIAKGKNYLPTNFKDIIKQVKRISNGN